MFLDFLTLRKPSQPSFAKKHKPAHVTRLAELLETDRAATGMTEQLRLQTTPKKRLRNVVGVRKPTNTATAAKTAPPQPGAMTAPIQTPTKEKAAAKPAVKRSERVQRIQAAAVRDPLIRLDLHQKKLLQTLDGEAKEHFRRYARKQKLSVAQNRNKDRFISEKTQEAWEHWRSAFEQCRTEAIAGLQDQLLYVLAQVQKSESAPVRDSGLGHELSDMTIIIKRLSMVLHRKDPENALPGQAIEYLNRRGLLDGSGTAPS